MEIIIIEIFSSKMKWWILVFFWQELNIKIIKNKYIMRRNKIRRKSAGRRKERKRQRERKTMREKRQRERKNGWLRKVNILLVWAFEAMLFSRAVKVLVWSQTWKTISSNPSSIQTLTPFLCTYLLNLAFRQGNKQNI